MQDNYQDPHNQREAAKYEKPVASREYILEILHQRGKPITHEALVKLLALQDEDMIEGLRRRLIAMQRDGQLFCNRRGAYALVSKAHLQAGRISAHKDGYGFFIPDNGTEDIFINARQMRGVFHGDRVLVSSEKSGFKGRKEGKIVEVIEHCTQQLAGRYFEESGQGFVEASSKQITQDILIPSDKKHKAKVGQMVVARIISQPSPYRQAVGEIIEVLGEHMAPGMETKLAIRTYDLPYEWSAEVLAEVQAFDPVVSEVASQGRKDLRHLPLITIDGDDAKDFDDAVYCEARAKEGWRLYVAIADVSHYVEPGTALDSEAMNRGNSVYFPTQVIPMLPEVLSNGLCSLKPQVDRLCLVCDMTILPDGTINRFQFYSAVMHSKARMTYTNVDKILNGDKKLTKQYEAIAPHLQDLRDLYHVLEKARHARGALDFSTTETRFVFGADKKIECILPSSRNQAHRLIEECMLAANVSAANFIIANHLSTLFRVHAEPAEEKIEEVRGFLAEQGLKLTGGKQAKPIDFYRLLAKIQDREDFDLIQTVILRSMNQAIYTPENQGHFGLAYKAYCHFTSPIRRYPDLLLHRTIKNFIEKPPVLAVEQQSMAYYGEHCSYTERRADEATRDVVDWLKCEFMQDKVGQVFAGKIIGVTSFGLFVLLSEVYVEGLVHISALPEDYYDHDATHHQLLGQRSGIRYRLGETITVQVSRINLERREMDFVIATSESNV